jgi:hypothetical protein
MELSSYVDSVGRELGVLAESAGDEARAIVERLAGSIDSVVRMALLEALSTAAGEITRDLAPGSVEVRLRGRDPQFVVTPPEPLGEPEPAAAAAPPPEPRPDFGAEDGPAARINFRPSEQLKTAIEQAAEREGRSVNAWLIRVTSDALRTPAANDTASTGIGGALGKHGPQRLRGWVR